MDWTSAAILTAGVLYLALNVFALLAFGFDKHRARKGGRRVPERRLLLIALFGPFGAAVAMRVFRHKTRKALFKLVPVFATLHVLVLFLAIY